MAETYAVKVENGIAKLYKSDCNYPKIICNEAVDAVVKGEEVHITMKTGKTKVFSVKGFLKKII